MATRVGDLSNVYSLNALFNPATGDLRVDGTISIVADERTDAVELLLNKTLKIGLFDCGPRCNVKIESNVTFSGQPLPLTQLVRLTPTASLQKGERLQVAFEYAGKLTTNDIEFGRGIVSPGWTEMSMDVLWYPVWMKEPMVRAEVLLQVPPTYDVTGPGKAVRISSGRWRLTPGVPLNARITFAASNNWVVREQALGGGLSARLFTVVEEPRAKAILSGVGAAYDYYVAILGRPRTDRTALKVLYANKDPGLKYPRQAYSTGGDFIVLDQSEPEVQLDTLHHEVAHLWFWAGRPGTPDEFLSESLSEYLAVRRGAQVWGRDWLAARRAKSAQRSAKIGGSLLDIDGFTPTRQDLLYERGSTALWSLHDRIGEVSMNELLEVVHASDVTTIAQFLAFWRQGTGHRR